MCATSWHEARRRTHRTVLTLLAVVALGYAAFAPSSVLASDQQSPVLVNQSGGGEAPSPNGPNASRSQDALIAPSTAGICAADSPIKAVTSEEGERTFFVPGDLMYDAILAERCFANEGAASSGGYRMHRH